MMITVICGLPATLHRKSASNETNGDCLWNTAGLSYDPAPPAVIRPVTRGKFQNRLKRGAIDG
ncbi:MAG: hypothetical protein ACRECP_12210 [Methylocella sp.]